MMTVSRSQLSLIHVAKAKLALADDDYRTILRRFGRVESSADLDRSGFYRVMDAFARLGFRSEASKRNFGTRPGMASPSQVDLIRALWLEFKGEDANDLTLGRWLERTFHVSSIRFLEAGQAQKAIGALKAMKARNFDRNRASTAVQG